MPRVLACDQRQIGMLLACNPPIPVCSVARTLSAGESDCWGERPRRQCGSRGWRRRPGRQRQVPQQQVGQALILAQCLCATCDCSVAASQWGANWPSSNQEDFCVWQCELCFHCLGSYGSSMNQLGTSTFRLLSPCPFLPSPQPADGPAAAGRHLPPPLPAAVPHPDAGKAG